VLFGVDPSAARWFKQQLRRMERKRDHEPLPRKA